MAQESIPFLTYSCNCYGRTGHGCKGHRATCPICDRNKVRRRCQSEGLYPEGDPLKELNWCCDRGCELLNRSPKCSQIKKTDLEMNNKKSCPDDSVVGGSHHYKKHHSKVHKSKHDELNNHYDKEIEVKYVRTSKHPDRASMTHENYPLKMYQDTISTNSKPVIKDKTPFEMKEKYIKEMEILRTKLNLLKDEMVTDGKRLRQRSESEPGFTELPRNSAKRARDNSPKLKMSHRKLPPSPDCNQSHHRFPVKQNMPFQRETKSLSPSSFKHSEKGSKEYRAVIREMYFNETDEDQEGSTCDEDDKDGPSDDDNQSVLSILTTASSDSNTPSKVGETLGSISLNEIPKKESVTESPFSVIVPETESSIVCNEEKNELFRISLFPNVPPYVKFFMHDLKGPSLPTEITKLLKWKLSSITPIVIRRTLLNSGFKLVRKSNEWTGQWGKHMKSFVFKTLKDFQKLNHFPGTFQIGRKDRLWKNLYRLIVKFGKKEFGFIPKTYILPHDRKLLRTAWEKTTGPSKGQWIVKPPAAARGTGIKVVHRWGQIPKKKSLIVQKYIAQPYLINGSKFDLRLYVLMTSIHPLRIYLYDDGLVRFASVKYSDDVEHLSNRFMHLTNYSINKLSTQYQVNADHNSCHGHKWSLKSLWTYLTKEGVNVKALRKNLTDLVIKTIISGESNINLLSKNNLPSRYCSYELFGIDVLLDQNLKPWLLEVNISPSLHSASPLDLAVKGPLVAELLNIAGFQIPAKLAREQEDEFLEEYGIKEKTHTLCYDKRMYWTCLSKEEKAKQEWYGNMNRKEYLHKVLDDLTPDDIRHLVQFEDELTQIKRFEKIFPTASTHVYHMFFDSPRYYNILLDAWETKYQKNRAQGIDLLVMLCQQKIHLNVPLSSGKAKSSQSLSDASCQTPIEGETESESEKEKEGDQEESKEEKQMTETSEVKDANEEDKESKEKKEEKELTEMVKDIMAEHYQYHHPKPPHSSPSKLTLRQKISMRPVVFSKANLLSSHFSGRRTMRTRSSKSPEGHRSPLKETCLKMLAEIRDNRLGNKFPNCKLETTSLVTGDSSLSPSKHMHNTCIKMSTSS